MDKRKTPAVIASAGMARRRGFTLVELLVVIGIIAILIGILMPALSRARDQSRTVQCLSNMRQIAMAAQAYASENKQYMLPCGTPNGAWWCNILVDFKYLNAPNGAGTGPQTGSVFWCPEGNMDIFSIDLNMNEVTPSARNDDANCQCTKHTSPYTGHVVHLWYGMNANEGGNSVSGPPARRITGAGDPWARTTWTKRSSEMVLFYDGLIYHYHAVNGNRLAARHAKKTLTNLAFVDGHAESFQTKGFPGGMKVKDMAETKAVFSVSNLKAKFPSPPMWLLDQQY